MQKIPNLSIQVLTSLEVEEFETGKHPSMQSSSIGLQLGCKPHSSRLGIIEK